MWNNPKIGFKNGNKPWNKSLTKTTDLRLLRHSKSLKENRGKGYKLRQKDVECHLCGQKFEQISWMHLAQFHDVTMKEYRKKFPEAKLVCQRVKKIQGDTCKRTQNSETRKKARILNAKKNSIILKEHYKLGLRKPPSSSKEAREKISKAMEGRKHHSMPHSEETKKKLSVLKTGKFCGENNPNWRGGDISKNQRIRKTKPFAKWRKNIFERDNYTCQKCGIRGGYLVAHHLKSVALYFERILDIENGITLCKPCHLASHKKRKEENINGCDLPFEGRETLLYAGNSEYLMLPKSKNV